MKSRHQKRQKVGEGIVILRALLDQQDDRPKLNLDLLTDRERHAFKSLKALADEDGVRDLSRLDDMQLEYLRALYRKAADEIDFQCPRSPDDRTDVGYLEKINLENFDVENISRYG